MWFSKKKNYWQDSEIAIVPREVLVNIFIYVCGQGKNGAKKICVLEFHSFIDMSKSVKLDNSSLNTERLFPHFFVLFKM